MLNLFKSLDSELYDIDFIIYDQLQIKGTVTLIEEIPEWIHVFNAAEEEYRIAYVKKAVHKVWRKLSNGVQLYRKNVYEFVKNKHYDVAISFGEWFSCSLVAQYVSSRRKYIWIHADMDKAAFLYPDILTLHQYFDHFLFVSAQSFASAVERYPFLKDRGLVLHNLVDTESILKKSEAACEMPPLREKLPILLTVANIRPEKNHLRQIQVMQELFNRGLRFYWLNIGNLANSELVRNLKNAVARAGLKDYFLLTGAIENPYPIMRQADAVCVLSDFESWSMVITEAKTLTIPVIATRTSGALEQLEDNETGVLCDFTIESIADAIERLLTTPTLSAHIQEQLKLRQSQRSDLQQIESLLLNNRKKTLYVFDNINYISGARNAALRQMNCLAQAVDVEAFSVEPCEDESLNAQWRICDLADNSAFRCLSVPVMEVLGDTYSLRCKLVRIAYAFLARIQMDAVLYEYLLKKGISVYLSGFDTVCVVSEASKLRSTVATLRGPRKVQWIHTDYAAWSKLNSWTKAITCRDSELYKNYDVIVCLSERLKERFLECMPHLKDKTAVIPNFIDAERVLRLTEEASAYHPEEAVLNLISVGRMEREKRYDRLLEIAAEVKKQRAFHWYFVGDGKLLPEMKAYCSRLGLDDFITFTGALDNPYPLMKYCDLFVLFSEYEGTPVTIDEAKVLGLQILANDVGGVKDQLKNYDSAVFITSKDCAADAICEADTTKLRSRRSSVPLRNIQAVNLCAEANLLCSVINST